jgi:galactose mutarotase-like enzyme
MTPGPGERGDQRPSAVAGEPVELLDEASQLAATFLPGAGMLCCSLRHRDDELLAQNRGVEAYVQSGRTMGVPLLYPWANRLAGFSYEVAGRVVAVPHDRARIALDDRGLPIHGVIGGRLVWQADEAPAPRSSLAARLRWSAAQPALFEVFPFEHDLLYEATLAGGRLEIAVTVDACGADPVPLAFGFHPYLAPPGPPRERWQVSLPAMRGLALDPRQIPVGPAGALPAQRFELGEREFDDAFDSVEDGARFSVTADALQLAVEMLDGYPCAQVFAPRGGRFICFEPMTAPANTLRSGEGLRLLAPGERARGQFALEVREIG